MIAIPPGVRVWLACGRTDMRKGMDGLAMLAQQVLNEDPFICVGVIMWRRRRVVRDFATAGGLSRHII
jgi:transposase